MKRSVSTNYKNPNEQFAFQAPYQNIFFVSNKSVNNDLAQIANNLKQTKQIHDELQSKVSMALLLPQMQDLNVIKSSGNLDCDGSADVPIIKLNGCDKVLKDFDEVDAGAEFSVISSWFE